MIVYRCQDSDCRFNKQLVTDKRAIFRHYLTKSRDKINSLARQLCVSNYPYLENRYSLIGLIVEKSRSQIEAGVSA